MFIREILLRNGIISNNMNSAPNTLCTVCGCKKSQHIIDSDSLIIDQKINTDPKKHMFNPVRFIMMHGFIDKNTIGKNMDKFNHPSNTTGDNIMILVGSRMIKESYNFKAIRHIMVMSRPDNIPMLIQIMAVSYTHLRAHET